MTTNRQEDIRHLVVDKPDLLHGVNHKNKETIKNIKNNVPG